MLPTNEDELEHEDVLDLEEMQRSVTLSCGRLDEILKENTLYAHMDGTLVAKLRVDMFTDEDWDLLALSKFISLETAMSEDRDRALAELHLSLLGVIQFFHYCDMEITDNWAIDINELGFSEELMDVDPDEFALIIATSARDMGMSGEEIFALLQYVCTGEEPTLH